MPGGKLKWNVEKRCNLLFFCSLRDHAKNLLEHTKHAVEIAIQQDEQAAIDWLDLLLSLDFRSDACYFLYRGDQNIEKRKRTCYGRQRRIIIDVHRPKCRKSEGTMKVNFKKKFKEILKEESKGFGIDWKLVEIKFIHYQLTDLPATLDEYTVRMRVIEDEIPDKDIDNWFRSHKFIYAMMSKHVKTEFDDMDMLTFDVGTIESIAMKTRDAFRDCKGQ